MNNNAPTMSMYIIDELIRSLTDEQLEHHIYTADFLDVFDYDKTQTQEDAYSEMIVLCKREQERREKLRNRLSEVDEADFDDLPF